MAYKKTIWVEGETPISPRNMNNIEEGIEAQEAALDAHKAEEATETDLGHIRLSDLAITDTTTGDKYKWGVENGKLFLEKVV